MNKKKYIEPSSGYRYGWVSKKYNRKKDMKKYKSYDNMPFRESMKKPYDMYTSYGNFINFRHIDNFLLERVGYNWDDVYSEILSKIRKGKHKYPYRPNMGWNHIQVNVMFDDDGLPFRTHSWRRYSLLVNEIFVDERNEIAYYDTREELETEYANRLRLKKLLRILEELDI